MPRTGKRGAGVGAGRVQRRVQDGDERQGTPITTLLIKLGSIAVHAEEFLSPKGHEFDKGTILSLLSDPEVKAFLRAPENQVYFPVKR